MRPTRSIALLACAAFLGSAVLAQGAAPAPPNDLAARRAAAFAKAPPPGPQQQDSLSAVQQDLAILGKGGKSAQDEVAKLTGDLQGLGLQPPDPLATQSLATDLQSALRGNKLSPRQTGQLAQDVYALVNAFGLTQQEINALQDDVESILVDSGCDAQEVEVVLADLEALAQAALGHRRPAGR